MYFNKKTLEQKYRQVQQIALDEGYSVDEISSHFLDKLSKKLNHHEYFL